MALVPSQTGVVTRLREFSQMQNQQKFGLMLAVAAIIALLAGAWMWSQSPDYRVLYTNVSDRDGGAIITAIQQMNVPYKFAEGGGAILQSVIRNAQSAVRGLRSAFQTHTTGSGTFVTTTCGAGTSSSPRRLGGFCRTCITMKTTSASARTTMAMITPMF